MPFFRPLRGLVRALLPTSRLTPGATLYRLLRRLAPCPGWSRASALRLWHSLGCHSERVPSKTEEARARNLHFIAVEGRTSEAKAPIPPDPGPQARRPTPPYFFSVTISEKSAMVEKSRSRSRSSANRFARSTGSSAMTITSSKKRSTGVRTCAISRSASP